MTSFMITYKKGLIKSLMKSILKYRTIYVYDNRSYSVAVMWDPKCPN